MAERSGEARRRRIVNNSAALIAATALTAGLAGCGGRTSHPVTAQSQLDARLSCAHLGAEEEANMRQIEDLRDERVENRIRSASRIPGALLSGNPFSLIFLADPSTAIYDEISALERRNQRIEQLVFDKKCGETPPSDPRIAAVTPIEDASALYEAQYEISEGAQAALTQEQPEVAPKKIEAEEAGEITAKVESAEQRDEATAEKTKERAAEEEQAIGEAYEKAAAAPTAEAAPAATATQ